jgi:hypothetical protein
VADLGVELVGYQANLKELELGWFLFNHAECRTTLSIRSGEFRDLYNGPVFAERRTGSGECPGYCLRPEELGPCKAKCECAYVREIIQIVRNRGKR